MAWIVKRVSTRNGCLFWLVSLLAGCGQGQGKLPPCYVDIPLYDARGNRLSYTVVAVTPEGEKTVDLLKFPQPQYRIVRSGERLYFSKEWVGGRPIEVTLRTPMGEEVVRIALMDCQQRTSIQTGRIETGLDSPVSTVRGRLTGCPIIGDWWVSAMPMFHGQEYPLLHEGVVQPDGAFRIISSFEGRRHIIVVGKGKDPVKAFAADVVAGGGEVDVDTIDLSGSCPK